MLKSVGWILFLAVPMLFIFLLMVLDFLNNQGFLGGILLLALLFSIHISRKDAGFLAHLNVKKWQLSGIEYFFFSIPISIVFWVVFQNWEIPITLQIGALLIAFLPNLKLSRSSKNVFQLSFIPIEAFEFRAGFRRYPYFALIYLLGIGFSGFVGGVPVAILIIMMSAVSFYENLEPKEIFEASYQKGAFLKRKISVHSLCIHSLFLPLYILFFLFNYEYWFVLLAVVFITQMTILFNIFFKYAHYLPRRRKINNQMASGFFFLGIIVPFFAPASIAAIFLYWRKAVARINYLYANNQ